MPRDIDITIAPDGRVEVKVVGHAGPGCRELTRQLRAALGRTDVDRTTAEYGQQAQAERRTRSRH